MPRKLLDHIKRVTARGRVYYYFDTGAKAYNRKGVLTTVYTRLPDPKDIAFGGKYAAAKAARTKRQAPKAMTIARLIDLYQRSTEYNRLAPATRSLYDTYLRELDKLAGDAPAPLFEPQDVRTVLDRMGNRVGAANVMLRLIGGLFAWGRGRGHVTCKPTEGISEQELAEHEPWPDDIIQAALTSDNQKVRLATHLLLYTGQRIGDVMRMRWGDIRGNRLFVTQQKTGKSLTLPLHSALRDELASTQRKGLTILCRQDGGAMSAQTVRIALKAHCQQFGRELVPHGLRKNAVIALLEAGCTVAEVASITGQSFRMVEHYAKQWNQPTLASAAILKWEGNAS